MKFKVEYITNLGLERKQNEDSMLIGSKIVSSISMRELERTVLNDEILLFAIADGMGGFNKGEVASFFVLNSLKNNIHRLYDIQSLEEVLYDVKKDLDTYVAEHKEYLNMGTVIAGILIKKNEFIVFNVGDCRVYENNFGYTQQLTKDHSFVYSLYEFGEIDYEEIKDHPKKNIVTSAFIGNKNSLLEEIFIKKFSLSHSKELLICSDGIWENLNMIDFDAGFRNNSPIEFLKQKTFNAGARDNFSAIYIKIINE